MAVTSGSPPNADPIPPPLFGNATRLGVSNRLFTSSLACSLSSASLASTLPRRPFSLHPQEYTPPSRESANTWSTPLTIAFARSFDDAGAYILNGNDVFCASRVFGLNAHAPFVVRNCPHAHTSPLSVNAHPCESPVLTITTLTSRGSSTFPGAYSASGSASLFTTRPSAPLSLFPQL